ncbi:MAG: hydroxymethylbilane synthase [Planctomycetota bacterium]
MSLTLSTRASDLALWQAHTTRAGLRAAWPELDVQLLKVESRGDQDRTTELARFGRIGIFTVEVDRALLDGRARVAVHSLKDMTTTLQEGTRLVAVLPRGPVEDVLVGSTLSELQAGSTLATGSLRRGAMLKAAVPGLETVPARGNVPTRVERALAADGTPTVLARAGIVRLELDHAVGEVLDTETFVPAVGQGIVGLVVREDDDEARDLLQAINCSETYARALAERALLRAMHGGCNVPLGAHATISGDELRLTARVLSVDGTEELRAERTGSASDAEAIGNALAEELIAAGAARLVEEARA